MVDRALGAVRSESLACSAPGSCAGFAGTHEIVRLIKGHWSTFQVDPPGSGFGFEALSCPTTTLCDVLDNQAAGLVRVRFST